MVKPVAKKKILLAVDGSDMSEVTVDYVANTMSPPETEVVLFHVFNKIPESFWDFEREPALDFWMNKVKTQEHEHEKAVKNFMEHARQTLLDSGFKEQDVVIKIQNRITGIARDIVAESGKNYDMLVMGRTGTSHLEGVTVGSVANKAIGVLKDLPICVVTGSPEGKNIMVAIDGSEGSMRAVAFLSTFRNISNRRVFLFHAMRRISFPQLGDEKAGPFTELEQILEEDARKMISPFMDKARNRLMEGGCSSENITVKMVSGVVSRAGALVAEAGAENCGSIVVGRKGVSQVEDFNIGRVCHKVIHKAKNMAVWIVP